MTERSTPQDVRPKEVDQEGLLVRWLRLEARQGEDGAAHARVASEQPSLAEVALGDLLVGLRLARPGAAFAERVLERTREWADERALLRAPALLGLFDPRRWLGHWGARAAVAVAAVQAGLLFAAAVTLGGPLLRAVEPLSLVTASAGALASSLDWLVGVPRLGIGLAEIGDSMARALSGSPLVLALLGLCLLSSAAGLYLLSALIPGNPRPAREMS